MHELITGGALQVLVAAFSVGIVVGLTGMGGGALMTPVLMLLGVPPTAAVTNDLVAAAVSKSAGAAIHLRRGKPNLRLAFWLTVGSVPMALVGSFAFEAVGGTGSEERLLRLAIGGVLLLTCATYTARSAIAARRNPLKNKEIRVRPVPTIAIGAFGGLLVGVTSVGSGSLIMVCLLILYPALAAVEIVGTDLVQAIPLVIAAAIGHVAVSGVDWSILLPVMLGSTPGTIIGARAASVVSQTVIRRGIVIVLGLTGLAMLGVPPYPLAAIGAAGLVAAGVYTGRLRRLIDAHTPWASVRPDVEDAAVPTRVSAG
ncbi:MAG: sulfite exporter TauE/SafE family protein [Microlunatus sp.]|nr:sulfite exporter TauE/SafE family protein [Microlunatus sp.]